MLTRRVCFNAITYLICSMFKTTHFYLQFNVYKFSDNDTELVVREGVTSTEEPIEALRMSNLSLDHTQARQYITPITRGFYISLKGVIKPESKLVVVYSAFSYKGIKSIQTFY